MELAFLDLRDECLRMALSVDIAEGDEEGLGHWRAIGFTMAGGAMIELISHDASPMRGFVVRVVHSTPPKTSLMESCGFLGLTGVSCFRSSALVFWHILKYYSSPVFMKRMRIFSVLLFIVMGVGILWGYWVENHFARTRPTESMPAQGRTFSLQYHGKTVYLTERELWSSRFPTFLALAAGVVGAAIWTRSPGKVT